MSQDDNVVGTPTPSTWNVSRWDGLSVGDGGTSARKTRPTESSPKGSQRGPRSSLHRQRSSAELEQLAQDGQELLADADAATVAAWAAENFGDSLAVACSMASDTVVVDLISRYQPAVDVLFLDTGYHFETTLETRDDVVARLPVTVINVSASESVAEHEAANGPEPYRSNPTLCCQLRKVDPLNSTLESYEAWVTGVRREDNALRANTQVVEWDAKHQMVKINPVAAWSHDQVMTYAKENDVPLNPLLFDGYPSIGCAPCTRKVQEGEDPRSGRWADSSKTECGIHV